MSNRKRFKPGGTAIGFKSRTGVQNASVSNILENVRKVTAGSILKQLNRKKYDETHDYIEKFISFRGITPSSEKRTWNKNDIDSDTINLEHDIKLRKSSKTICCYPIVHQTL